MASDRCSRVLATAAIAGTIACGGSPAPPLAPNPPVTGASIAIVGLTATVEPLTTTPAPGLLYRLTYQVHESNGRSGATLITQHFSLSDGTNADGNFNTAVTPPHVAPTGTITVQSTLSIYPATSPASHVMFSVTFTDDAGGSGTARAEADISLIGPQT